MMTAEQAPTGTDRIEKRIALKAPRARVWRALTTAEEFGTWFGVKFDGAFAEGATMRGTITSKNKGVEGKPLVMVVDRIQPQDLFSYRWHPNAHDASVDYSGEPMTLVEFRLTEAGGTTTLTIVETGFDSLPVARRAPTLRSNEGGWATMVTRIEEYVASA